MLTRLRLVFCVLMATAGLAFATVDVNKGDLAALTDIKGIGPAKAKRIIDERSKGGNFKSWADFESRVPGVGEKSASRMSQSGLILNGKPKGVAESNKKNSPKSNVKTDMKSDKKSNPKTGALSATSPSKPAANAR